jgi:acetyl-CoA acetyltransferase
VALAWAEAGINRVMRHADAGYKIARACAREMGLKLPMGRKRVESSGGSSLTTVKVVVVRLRAGPYIHLL